jgi:DNA repair exonuclease SbcCD ATPase subunit
MESEPTERWALSVSLSPALEEWLSERADQVGVEREELLVSLLAAYRDATTDESAEAVLEERAEALVERRLDQFDEDIERKLNEIRRRVVQLKGETDSKADAETVEELTARLDELESAVEELPTGADPNPDETAEPGASVSEEELAALRESLRSRAETAVKLDERLDDVESKLTRVARAVVTLRKEHEAAEQETEAEPMATLATAPDETLMEIKRQAAREEIRTADCGACGERVGLSVLPEAACPHCGASFGGLDGVDGMFSSPRLVGDGGPDDE